MRDDKNSKRSSAFHISAPVPQPLKEGEDFYREGAVIVFTARYHLKRGYCCESGCRHCPYRAEAKTSAVEFEKEADENDEASP